MSPSLPPSPSLPDPAAERLAQRPPGGKATLALFASILLAFVSASSAPSPLYRLYQSAWSFGSTWVTVVFAVYALVLLLSLLITGRLSDYLGRKPVMAVALITEIVAMSMFWNADSLSDLIVARMLQGFATGMATTSVGAALIDLNKERGAFINSMGPMFGTALGALGSTALMVYFPAPTQTVFGVFLTVFALQAIALFFAPETARRRPGAWASLRPRIAVPAQARSALRAVSPSNMAVWMLGGFYLSLMPSLVQGVTQVRTPWLSGLVIAALTASGAISVICLRAKEPAWLLRTGQQALMSGIAIILLGANFSQPGLLLIGSLTAGCGFGVTFLGALGRLLPLAKPHERSALMGVFYTQSYLAHSVPTIAAGYLAQRTNLLTAANVYGAVIVALVLGTYMRTRRSA
ncbi:MFS transporter [Pusillimonas caeni]|uniref:MFS transporter n=1 Tax=Pusillimonas caeni TaxID=1348472 RepID=UPI000E59DD7E|nr:MFS transporter [Pusillimonas caeni]TFL13309.1 MFS transporter [Pusillimonas caeni]